MNDDGDDDDNDGDDGDDGDDGGDGDDDCDGDGGGDGDGAVAGAGDGQFQSSNRVATNDSKYLMFLNSCGNKRSGRVAASATRDGTRIRCQGRGSCTIRCL